MKLKRLLGLLKQKFIGRTRKNYILLFLLFNCVETTKPISPLAKKYLDDVISILQTNSINRKTIDWRDFKKKVYEKASGANSIEEIYPSVEFAVTLSDKHSFFSPKTNNNKDNGQKPPIYSDIQVPDDIGYIRIPWFIGNQEEKDLYVNKIHTQIRERDKSELKGWIVDLRGNMGGNMWPMLAGIGPVLGDGVVGSFVDADNNKQEWRHEKGKVFLDEEMLLEVKEYHNLKTQNPIVAVLTDTITASSGEAVTIAFRERSNTRSFGTRTHGVSTGNQPFYLSDESVIWLTTVVFADRKMNKYGGHIEPDEKTESKLTIEKAINWIRNEYHLINH